MRKAAAVVVLIAVGCASAASDLPPPQAAAAAPDPRLVELQTSLTELLERLDVINDRLSRLERSREASGAPVSSPELSPSPSSRPPVAATVSSPLRGAEIAEQYRSAIMLLGGNRIEEARREFQKVFAADASGELADNALFWIGETYYRQGDYPNAISHYRRVSQEYGDQNKAPDAVYKLGLAYAKTGDLVLARQALQEVIARYPYSTPAASAKAELDRIKY